MPHLYDFADADGSDRDLLGGKGAGLAEMTGLGLPVPPGFVITTDVCRHTMETREMPDDLWDQVDEAIGRLEGKTGRKIRWWPHPGALVGSVAAANTPCPG